MRRLALVLLAAITLSGCWLNLNGTARPPEGIDPVPDPPLRAPIPPEMAAAIAAAEPIATELTGGNVALRTAFELDLAEWCGPLDDVCPETDGPGWGVVFTFTGPDGLPSRLLVVLDDQLTLQSFSNVRSRFNAPSTGAACCGRTT